MSARGNLYHGQQIDGSLDLFGRQQISFATSTTGAQSAALGEGVYDVWTDQDAYLKVAPTANDVTTSTGYLLRAGNTVSFYVREGHKIGAVLAAGTGTLRFHMVG